MVLAMTAVGTLVAVGLLVVVYHWRRPMVSRWSSPRNKPWLREYRTLVEPSGRGMSFAPDGIEMTWNDSTHADARRCAPSPRPWQYFLREPFVVRYCRNVWPRRSCDRNRMNSSPVRRLAEAVVGI
jgi:hypothetical protein